MIKRKIYLIVVFGILGIVISYIVYFLIYSYIADSRLTTIEGKSDFDITAILDISKDRIIVENETYNKTEFIEYDCIIDNTYCITIVKVGKVTNDRLLKSIYFENQPFPSRTGWFNNDITTPYPFHNFFMPHVTLYNVFLLPLKEVDKINVYVKGEVIGKEYIADNTVSYYIESFTTLFSFNDMNKCDLEIVNGTVKAPITSNIFFTIDKDSNLYIGCVSSEAGVSKTLKEIVNN